jgi:DNA-binding GntR family transcriptional regulator
MIAVPSKKDIVYERIRQAIITGVLKPGEILNEAEIAAKFESGKTPAREALLLLTHAGYLDSLPRVGYMVTKPTLQDILETFHLRIILEVEAIGLAIGRLSPEDIRRLQENNEAEEKLTASMITTDKSASSALNREFHLTIAQLSGNNRLATLIQQLMDDMERMLINDPYLTDPSQHKKIMDALLTHDKGQAQEAMRFHIAETRNRIVNRLSG